MFKKIYVLKSGRIKAVVENRAKDAKEKSKSKTFGCRNEAEAWAIATMHLMQQNYLQDTGKIGTLSELQRSRLIFMNRETLLDQTSTVRDVINAFLIYTNSVPKPASKTAQSALKNILNYQLGNYPLFTLNYNALEDYCKERLTQCSASTVRIDISSLARAIRELKEANKFKKTANDKVSDSIVITHFPALKKQGFIADAAKRYRRIKDDDELARLLTSARIFSERSKGGLRLDLLIIMSIETTIRASELVSMRWEDVDLVSRHVIIRVGKNVRPETVGTAESPRAVPLTKRAIEVLRTLENHADKRGLVFKLTRKYYSTVFTRIKAHADIAGLQLRDLRREGISRLIEKGYSVLQIAEFTGHRDMRMIEDIYNAAGVRKIIANMT